MSHSRSNGAMIGYGLMGAAHSHGWRVGRRFFDPPVEPRLPTIVGRDQMGVELAARTFGWDSTATDWRRVIEDNEIDLVGICATGSSWTPASGKS